MNVLGHAHVALEVAGDEPAWVLGAVLPDLAPAAGVRVDRHALPEAVAAGLRCHLAADTAFHALPPFVRGAGDIRRALGRRGVTSGPARAVGHAGWELLLDGTLLGSDAAAAVRRALAAGPLATPAMSAADAGRWATFVHRALRAPAARYDEPPWVAARLHAVLARRPRLRLPAGHVAVVSTVLAAYQPDVRAAAGDVLRSTATAAVGRAPWASAQGVRPVPR
ncbi:MAG TPA: hypothetical protein VFW63_11555 [Acidimicrobiales bacterium]|nr:hypothetical protein [Acidimicrobiales bacterium]